MKQSKRYRMKKKGDGLVDAWPADAPPLDELAAEVSYIGSGEHKVFPVHGSYNIDPDLRSTNSACPTTIERSAAEQALRRAVRQMCVSDAVRGRFPRYVWARIGGSPYCARLTNEVQGQYKGWPVAEAELPPDRQGRLRPEAWMDNER